MMDIPKPAATRYSLNVFSKPEVLVTVDNSLDQEILPVSTSNPSLVEFWLTTNRNKYLRLQSTELKVKKKHWKMCQSQHQLGIGSCRCRHFANN